MWFLRERVAAAARPIGRFLLFCRLLVLVAFIGTGLLLLWSTVPMPFHSVRHDIVAHVGGGLCVMGVSVIAYRGTLRWLGERDRW